MDLFSDSWEGSYVCYIQTPSQVHKLDKFSLEAVQLSD